MENMQQMQLIKTFLINIGTGRGFTDSMYSNRARSFYEQKVAELGRVSRQQLLQDKGVQPTTRFLIGAMYMFCL